MAALTLCVAFLSSCDKKQGATAEGPKVDSTVMMNKETVKKWFAAMNAHDITAAMATVDPAFIDHSPPPTYGTDAAAMKKGLEDWLGGYPDMKLEVVDIVAEGDRVAVTSHMVGTNSGPMMGMPPTNKKVDLMGVDILKMKNGKVTEHWGYVEEMKMMQQLGMMPDMSGAAKPAEPAKKK